MNLKERIDDLEKRVDAIANLVIYYHNFFQELSQKLKEQMEKK